MFIKNLYYQFNNALPTMVCNQLITIGTEQTEQYKTTGFIEGTTGGGSGKKRREVPGHRKSQVCFIQEQWLFNLILPYIDEANKRAGWLYQWDQCEAVQFTQYGVGDYYKWHMDGQSDRDGAYRKKDPAGKKTPKNWIGKVRKLSATIILNENYEGGVFEILSDPYHDKKTDTMTQEIRTPDIKSPGTILVFPSYLHHRITKITKGVRHSLVVWCLGQPFV